MNSGGVGFDIIPFLRAWEKSRASSLRVEQWHGIFALGLSKILESWRFQKLTGESSVSAVEKVVRTPLVRHRRCVDERTGTSGYYPAIKCFGVDASLGPRSSVPFPAGGLDGKPNVVGGGGGAAGNARMT